MWDSEFTTNNATIQGDSAKFVPSLCVVGLGPINKSVRLLTYLKIGNIHQTRLYFVWGCVFFCCFVRALKRRMEVSNKSPDPFSRLIFGALISYYLGVARSSLCPLLIRTLTEVAKRKI
jgi:hypothetical protein